MPVIPKRTLRELEQLPTLRQTQTHDVKIETGELIVMLSRMSRDDGALFDHEVREYLRAPMAGGWYLARRYEAPDR